MRIFSLVLLLFWPAWAYADAPFIWPLACTPNVDCGVIFQPDVYERVDDMKDAACGDRTSDNRINTIIALSGLNAVKSGTPVLAIADGQIERVERGLPDGPDKGCGNGVLLWHKGGWSSEYCGLLRGSTSQAKGDYVRRGETIGYAGMSGALRWPGLAFTLRKFERPYDLWSGNAVTAGCGALRPLIAGLAYWPVSIIQSGITTAAPGLGNLKAGVTPPKELTTSDQVVLWSHMAGLRESDSVQFTLVQNGKPVWQTGGPANPRSPIVYAVRKAPQTGWTQGILEGRIAIVREKRVIAQTRARVTIK